MDEFSRKTWKKCSLMHSFQAFLTITFFRICIQFKIFMLKCNCRLKTATFSEWNDKGRFFSGFNSIAENLSSQPFCILFYKSMYIIKKYWKLRIQQLFKLNMGHRKINGIENLWFNTVLNWTWNMHITVDSYPQPFNTKYATDSYLVYVLKMEYVYKFNIFCLKMMVKSGLEKIF